MHPAPYDREGLRVGIVHLGPGGFHRAHLARYTDALMRQDPEALGWGIAGVGLRPADTELVAGMTAQNNLYTLVERNQGGATVRTIGSIARTLHVDDGVAPVLGLIAAPTTAIVSLTITQAGYCIDNGSKRLDPAHPAIVRDLAHRHDPRTAVGLIVEGLARRRAAGVPAFTGLSCDNIQHNGDVLRQAVVDFAALIDPALADWIAAEVRFPNAMVDRITPVATDADRAWLSDAHGIDDPCAVFCEPFSQWVIEDRFPSGRPAWETAGARFVDDVTPFEFMKLRLLNATHLAIAAPGQLMGHERIDAALSDARLRRFATALIARETLPTVPPPPGVDLQRYAEDVLRRFANPMIGDTTERVNTDASLNYLLDPLRDRLARGQDAPLLGFAVACWVRRAIGNDDRGAQLRVANPAAAALRAYAKEHGDTPETLLGHRPTFGGLTDNPEFRRQVANQLRSLAARGVATGLAGLG